MSNQCEFVVDDKLKERLEMFKRHIEHMANADLIGELKKCDPTGITIEEFCDQLRKYDYVRIV